MGGYKYDKKEKIGWALLLLFSFLLFFYAIYQTIAKLSKFKISSGNGDTKRMCDPQGCGHFGASRGNRKHNGLDLKLQPGQIVYVPFSCKVTKFGQVYTNPSQFKYIEIQGMGILSAFKMRLMYVVPTFGNTTISNTQLGQTLEKGQGIGTVQDIAGYYQGGMTNHVHVELRILGVLVDPEPFFQLLN